MFKKELHSHQKCFIDLEKQQKEFDSVCDLIIESIYRGSTLLIAGNGGSASDAQHLSAEIIWRFEKERFALPAIALSSNISTITAIGNDKHFDFIYSRQIEAIGKPKDIFLAISTSGESANIIEAINTANKLKLITIGLTGNKSNSVQKLSSKTLSMPSDKTSRIQEMHLFFYHYLCKRIDEYGYERNK
tara:strand:- start:1272 stop:1838 length:567 start_codon:yes stop_codon:yes gene_type:complete